MCLDTITEPIKDDDGIGYKVLAFNSVTGLLDSPLYDDVSFKIGEPTRDSNHHYLNESNSRNQPYRTGFHLFKTLDGAKNWLPHPDNIYGVYKVRYSDISAVGVKYDCIAESNFTVVVARTITVLEKVS